MLNLFDSVLRNGHEFKRLLNEFLTLLHGELPSLEILLNFNENYINEFGRFITLVLVLSLFKTAIVTPNLEFIMGAGAFLRLKLAD